MVYFDEFLTTIGEYGAYQKFLYLVIGVIVFFAGGFTNLTIVFLVATPNHWCKSPSLDHLNLTRDVLWNLTIPVALEHGKEIPDKCLQYDRDYTNWTMGDVNTALSQGAGNISTGKCKYGWDYDHSVYESTLVTDWDLVCGQEMWVATSKSIYLAGFFFGILTFGSLADRFGRKKTYIVTVILKCVLALLVPFSPNLISFIVIRFFLGAISIANFTIYYILIMEVLGLHWRGFFAITSSYIGSAISLTSTGFAYFFRDWRTLAFAFATPTIIQLVNIFLIDESPRWLYTQGRKEEANKILKKIAKRNKKEIPEKFTIDIKEQEKGKITDLFRYPRLRMRALILCAQWFSTTMVFYGLAYNSIDFGYGGNPYINYTLGMLVGIPSNIVVHISQRFMGRKPVVIIFNVVGGISLLVIAVYPDSYPGASIITMVLSLLGRLCADGAFLLIYLYTAEMMPTVVRSIAMGTASATARIGGILSQYLMELKSVSILIPYLTMGGLPILVSLLVALLPETKEKNLPETLLEGESFGCKDEEGKKESYKEAEIVSSYM